MWHLRCWILFVLRSEEVLVSSSTSVYGDRNAMKSLMPLSYVDEDVINLVVERQNWLQDSLSKKRSVWYMPTSFSVRTTNYNTIITSLNLYLYYLDTNNIWSWWQQCALDWHHNPEEMIRRYQKSYIKNPHVFSKVRRVWFAL